METGEEKEEEEVVLQTRAKANSWSRGIDGLQGQQELA